MKRYWLFGSNSRAIQCGGMKDFLASFEAIEEALAPQPPFIHGWLDWAHVVDSTTGKIIAERERDSPWRLMM